MTVSPSEHTPADAESMREVGAEIAGRLRPGDLVLLRGDLGAGKTTLVTGIAAGLGHDPLLVSSPSFVLSQEYTTPGRPTLVHVDAWRMRGAADLDSIGFDELRHDPSLIVCVEWPERVEPALGDLTADSVIEIVIEHLDQGRRVIVRMPTSRSTTTAASTRRCHTCRTLLPPDAPEAPFCSDRCRMADLHRWFSGEYRIGREIQEEDGE